ncbi:DUF935 domain-containing protein [Fundidesulfovibrio putealis]|uniref:DUF935 domain-containing protein n=1 Tax=Fundidesulfovibrio putealis TaxID=270496 RepID=UPI0004243017|nr:DUF935 family protein [Fundidesulfovibrio putealis]
MTRHPRRNRKAVNFASASPRRSLFDQFATRERSPDFSGLLKTIPDPDPVLRKLGQDVSVYKELLSDPRVGPCVESRKAAVISMEWEIGRGRAKSRQAKFVEGVFKDLDLDRIIREILDAPLFGMQPMEVDWGKVGGSVVPVDVVGKPLRWFVFDADNNLRLRTRDNLLEGEELPERKFLLPRYNATFDDPYGERVLSRVFWPVVFKRGGMEFWVRFVEKFGMPYLMGRHPRGCEDKEIRELAEALEAAVQDAVIVVPDDASVELKEAAGKSGSSALYRDLKNSCDEDIAISILGQNLTTNVSGGSLAAAEVHERVRREIKDGDKKIVAKAFNRLIDWICHFNFGDCERPEFVLFEEEDVDQKQAERDKTLADTGQLRFSKKYWMRTYGFEEDDIELVEEKPASSLPPGQPPAEFNEGEDISDQTAIDMLAGNIPPEQLQAQAEALLGPVLALCREAASIEDIMTGLVDAFPDLDTEEFEKRLTMAIFIADLWGMLNAAEGR